MLEKLNENERQEWHLQLGIVKKGKEYFWQTVEALAAIKRSRLFREEFESFDAFTRAKLDMTGRYGDMLIQAVGARTVLGTIVPENLASRIEKPWKLRNLNGLTPDKMKEVVEHAESVADGSEITAKLLVASKRIVMGLTDTDEDSDTSEEIQAFKDALSEIDSVDALQVVLESLGSLEDQATILAEVCPELVAAIQA